MYAMLSIRPDLCFSISYVSQFLNNPGKKHWLAVKRILRYLKGTVDYGIKFSKTNGTKKIIGYSDADWGSNIDDRVEILSYRYKAKIKVIFIV